MQFITGYSRHHGGFYAPESHAWGYIHAMKSLAGRECQVIVFCLSVVKDIRTAAKMLAKKGGDAKENWVELCAGVSWLRTYPRYESTGGTGT